MTYPRAHTRGRRVLPRVSWRGRNDAQAQCDRCSHWVQHSSLSEQMEFRGGTAPVGTGIWVCGHCLDVPNPQGSLNVQVLKQDPDPVMNARPDTTTYDLTVPSFSVHDLPDSTVVFPGYQIYVTGISAEPVLCYADGSIWRNFETDAVVVPQAPISGATVGFVPPWVAAEISALAPPSGFIYVRMASAGLGDGSSWDNATTLASGVNALILMANSEGKQILLRADEGEHTPPVNVTITASGISQDLPVVIRGVNGDGSDGIATITGDRAPVFAPGATQGNPWLRLRGATFLTFSRIRFKNWGNGALLINDGNVSDIGVLDCAGENLYRFIENAGSSGGTASCARIAVRRFDGTSPGGFERAFWRIQYDSHDFFAEDVVVDGNQQIDDPFQAGFAISGTAHNFIYRRAIASNFQVPDTTDPANYWNGDGFSGERGNYNILHDACEAYDCTDGGFDYKSTNTYFRDCKGARNKNNIRVWGDPVIENFDSRDPLKRGGTGSAAHLNAIGGVGLTIYVFGFTARDTNPSAVVYHVQTGVASVVASNQNDIVTAGAIELLESGCVVTYVTPNQSPPLITVLPTPSVEEGAAFSMHLTASTTPLYWEIVGGADWTLFLIDDWILSRTGTALTLPAQDLDDPADTNGNNVYDVSIQAVGPSISRSVVQDIALTVTNVLGNEGGSAVHVRPVAHGTADGSDWANAYGLVSLDAAVQSAAISGLSVWIRSDETHTFGAAWTSLISITHGGSDDAHHVVIEGRDAFGNLYAPTWAAGDAKLNNPMFTGNRTAWTLPADPEQVTSVSSWVVGPSLFRLGPGANYLTFRHLGLSRLSQPFTMAGGTTGNPSNHHLLFEDIDLFNTREGFFMDGTHGNLASITCRRVKAVGFSKRISRFRANSSGLLFEDFHLNSGRQDRDNFSNGMAIDDTAHDVVVNGTMPGGKYDGVISNCHDSSQGSNYWNADGISSERGNYNIAINRVTSIGHTDAGFDLKSAFVTLTDCITYDAKKGYKVWGISNVLLVNCESHDSHIRGGSSSTWIFEGATDGRIALKNCNLHDGVIHLDDNNITWLDTATTAALVNTSNSITVGSQIRAWDPTNTTTPVTISSSATPSVNENTAFSQTTTANAALDMIEITGGTDAALFTATDATLQMIARDFEHPFDANSDNAYEVTIRAYSTGLVISADQAVSVTVLDVAVELPPTAVFSTDWEGSNGATSLLDDNGIAISLVNGATLSTASPLKGTSSLNITDVNDGANIADSASWDVNGEYSFLTIIHPTSLASTVVVASHYSVTSSNRSWQLQINTNGSITLTYSLNGSSTTPISSIAGVVVVNDTKEIAWDRDITNTVRVYYDGAMVAKSVVVGAFAASNALLRIGNTTAQNAGMIGKIDRTRIYQDYSFCGTDAGYTVAT